MRARVPFALVAAALAAMVVGCGSQPPAERVRDFAVTFDLAGSKEEWTPTSKPSLRVYCDTYSQSRPKVGEAPDPTTYYRRIGVASKFLDASRGDSYANVGDIVMFRPAGLGESGSVETVADVSNYLDAWFMGYDHYDHDFGGDGWARGRKYRGAGWAVEIAESGAVTFAISFTTTDGKPVRASGRLDCSD